MHATDLACHARHTSHDVEEIDRVRFLRILLVLMRSLFLASVCACVRVCDLWDDPN
jgi:hypothetical protein